MTRLEFINDLGPRLHGLPQEEVRRVLGYYVESIDDRMEDGMTEEEAIESLGSPEALAERILAEQSLPVPAAPEPPVTAEPLPKPRRQLTWWMILLIVLGSPIWISLGAAALGVAVGLYAVVVSLLIALWSVAISLILGGVAAAAGVWFLPVQPDTIAVRIMILGGGLLCAGLGILLLPVCKNVTVWFAGLHSKIYRRIRYGKEMAA